MKRTRIEDGFSEKSIVSDSPTQTLLVSNMPIIPLSDTVKLFEKFGPVQAAMNVGYGTLTLVEYTDINTASDMVKRGRITPFFVGPNKTPLEFSSVNPRSLISNYSLPLEEKPRILKFQISNSVYPITVDVMKTICGNIGKVVRILVGKKDGENNCEALVEFSTNSEAEEALENLNGADIYSGCCSLRVTFSKLDRLQIKPDDPNGYDSRPNADIQSTAGLILNPLNAGQPMLMDNNSPNVSIPPPGSMSMVMPCMPPQNLNVPTPMAPLMPMNPQAMAHRHVTFNTPTGIMTIEPPMILSDNDVKNDTDLLQYEEEDTVVIFQRLPPMLNSDHLFNMCCLYGNVAHVKFMMTRPGYAMVQMGNPQQADRVIKYYSGFLLFGSPLEVFKGSNCQVNVPAKIMALPDGTPSYKNYKLNANNRFLTMAAAQRYKDTPPHQTLHFYNCPAEVNIEHLQNLLAFLGCPMPKVIKIIPKPSKAVTGIIEFITRNQAAETLAFANHCVVRHTSRKYPHHLKMTFFTKTGRTEEATVNSVSAVPLTVPAKVEDENGGVAAEEKGESE